MNNKKVLAVSIIALVVVIAASMAVYNVYVDKVDPTTGAITDASQTMAEVQTFAATAAQDFTMQDASGKTVKLSDFKGTPVVLNFWTSWCSYCRSEMPYFESAYKQYGDQVQFIMLNPVKSERSSNGGKTFIQESGYTFPVFYETEGKAITSYGLRGFPATIFIDANGNIVDKNLGAISQAKLNEMVQTLLAKK
ncbi:Thiol-disulfide oxidoreductase ResA [bioreactor metagenome]|uniref:Thiol-disulfide oxidoreductase ResA n=1 Tax=bioreactor metagenome TaxID=1076179 RepID=A0A644WX03_9ZZZZ